MSWWGRTVNRMSNSVKKFTSNKGRLSKALLSGGVSELSRTGAKYDKNLASFDKKYNKADLGQDYLNKYDKEKIEPGPFIDEDARRQSSNLLADQMKTADQFERDLPGYIENEYGSRASGIKQQSSDTKKSLQDSLNSRGMLHSGLRTAKEGRLGAETAGLLHRTRGDVTRDALMRAQAMKTDPALSAEAGVFQSQNQLANLDQIKASRDAFTNQMMGQAFGNIGAGVGRWAGDKNG